MRRIALPLALLLGALVAAPAPAADRYALANQCWTLTADGGSVAKGDGGYVVGQGEAERFFLKPTTLGKYMLYGKDGDHLAAGGSGVAPAPAPGAETEWTIDVAGDGYSIVNENEGRSLTVAAGRLGTGSMADAARFGFEPAQGCTPFPEIETSTEGEPKVNPLPWTEVRGFADLHMHGMAFEFFGGEAHCGRPWHPYGVTVALVDCPDHRVANGEAAVLDRAYTGYGGHDHVGWPTFKDWPHYNSVVHEQSYWRWTERAWRGGLRLYVNLLTDNAVLCDLYPFKRHDCNEMNAVRRQAADVYALQDYIDAQYGGPGKGFFRIVKDPFEARRVINEGKLAVVLGIEISKLFECGEYNDVPECDRGLIDAQLDEVHRMGVRQMEIVNKFDNGLTGVAGDAGTTGQITNTGNKYETGHYWAMQTCTNEDSEHVHDREQVSAEGEGRDILVGDVLRQFLPPDATSVTYPEPPHCNKRGLTPLGAYTIRKMAERKMLFDPDHMSVTGRDQAMSVIESMDYAGVLSSHSWSSPDADARIYRAGGTIAPMAGNATSWMNEWKRLKPMRDRRFYFGMGMGADMGGFARQGPPRADAAEKPLQYPFKSLDGAVTVHKQRSGERVYDLNVDGIAHYGLFADYVADIRTVGGDEPVEDLARATEAYLQTWERAEGISGERCRPRGGRFLPEGLRDVNVGIDTARMLRDAGQPVTRRLAWRWCVQGVRGARVSAVFNRKGISRLVASTAPAHQARGVRPGDRARRLKSRTRRVMKGVYVRRAGNRRTYVYGLRKGRVTFAGVATRDLASKRGKLRRALERARVR